MLTWNDEVPAFPDAENSEANTHAETESTAPSGPPLKRLGILISGRGSNCLAIAEAIASGRLPGCEIAIVICNIPGAAGVAAARALGLQTVTMEGRGRPQRDHEDAIDALLRKMRVDLVCLAGYRRILSAGFVRRWPERIVNIHPSLLPAFPGMHAQRQAIEGGVRFAGCTVHFVDETVDGGVMILQRLIEVLDDDTEASLSERLLPEEHLAYANAIARVLSGEYEVRGRRYARKPAANNEDSEQA